MFPGGGIIERRLTTSDVETNLRPRNIIRS